MLESLSRTQPAAAAEISSALSSGMLPQSLLLSGRRGSSRLTGALDLSFHLTGEEERRDVLRSSSVLYIASRDLMPRFRASLSLFRRQRTDRSRLFLIQSVRTGLLQYHQATAPLYEGKKSSVRLRDQDGRGGTIVSNADAVDALMMELEDCSDAAEKDAARIADELEKRITPEFFSLGKRTLGATIDEIRAIQDWLEEGVEEKCVILEGPEDFTEGARNSMLKMLEEPPAHSHLMLISANASRIMPTILSRVRRIQFPDLSEKAVSSLIGDIFSIYGSYRTFDSFFFEEGSAEEDRHAMDEAVSAYSEALISGRRMDLEEEERLFSSLERISGYGYFREQLCQALSQALRSGCPTARMRRVWHSLSSSLSSSDSYNLSVRFALDAALREASDAE